MPPKLAGSKRPPANDSAAATKRNKGSKFRYPAAASLDAADKAAAAFNDIIKKEGGTTNDEPKSVVSLAAGLKMPPPPPAAAAALSSVSVRQEDPHTSALKARFLQLLEHPEHQEDGVTNQQLKEMLGTADYPNLVPIINELLASDRLDMVFLTRGSQKQELCYMLRSSEKASIFTTLDNTHKMVYQIIAKSRNAGIWTKDIRVASGLPQQALTKVIKVLENKRLIKPIKGVQAKAKKLYMLFDLTPSTELTGGIWYSDELSFDYTFVEELRQFLLHCLRRVNHGNGATLAELQLKMKQAQVSKVEVPTDNVQQLLQTLVYDHLADVLDRDDGTTVYVSARRVTTMCDFRNWDCLDDDFHFRAIQYEDGVTLAPHEQHYHTAP